MSGDKNEISEVSLKSEQSNIPLQDSMKSLEEFRNWIKEHSEYPQKMSNIFNS